MNSRRTCRCFWLALSFSVRPRAALASRPATSKPSKPLNVLVLLSDDQRFDTIHALGNAEIRTPNLDRLVASGFIFRNNYVMGSMGGAVCVPSRAMFNSGRTLWHVKENLAGVPLWGETMQQAGYATFGVGKWHNGQPSFARSFQAGKAVFFGGMSDQSAVKVQDLDRRSVELRRGSARSSPANCSPTRPSTSSAATRARSRSSSTWRSPRRTTRARRPASMPRCTIRRSCRCRRTSCRNIRSTTASCGSATSCWPRTRARPRSSAGTWPTTTA